MKKKFKFVFMTILIGWLPFMMIAIWGSWNRSIGAIVGAVGILTCMMGVFSFLAFLNNTKFWNTQEELEEAIKQTKEEYDRYIKARNILIDAALKFKEK